MTIPCSVYIVTLNCEPWIARTLESVRQFKEVVLVDSGSTDQTLQIAASFPNVRVFHQDWLGYSGQKQFAASLCTQPWLLNLDGDEELSPELEKELGQFINRAVTPGQTVALDIPVLDYFMGEPAHGSTRLHHKVRFYRSGHASYDLGNLAHEGLKVNGPVSRIDAPIYHYGETGVAVKVDKNNQYSSLKAKEKFLKNRAFSPVKLVTAFPLAFTRSYVLRRNFVNGWRGFIGSTINAFYAFMKEAKLYELHLLEKKQVRPDRPALLKKRTRS